MNAHPRSRRIARGTAVALAAAGLLAGPAGAVHWPFFGGDAGRSGYQPVDVGSGPIDFLYARTGAEDRDIVTSILTGAGQPAAQRVVYGTGDGRIHVRTLLDGAAVGPAAGIDVSDQPNPFGDGVVGSASFAETSSGAGQGQVFAPHNDAAGVSIAQVDEATGALVQDVAVAAAAGFDVNGSALLGAADGAGTRALFFVAESAAGEQALFRVPISTPTTTAAVVGAATRTADVNANPEASPTLAFLETPGGAGAPVAHVAVGTLDGRLLTFAATTLTAGPSATIAGPNDEVQTPSVPVSDTGLTPGSAGSNATKAPFLYAASSVDAQFDDGGTRVHRVTQAGNAATFTEVESALLAGSPSSALAVDQEVVNGLPEALGSVFVATDANLYAVRSTDLAVTARLSPTDSRVGGLDGFGATVPAASGSLVFVATDDGRQLVLSSATLQPVADSSFTQNAANAGSVASIGQPSLSRRFLQFASDKGLFVYRFRDTGTIPPTTPPATTPTGPGPAAAIPDGYWLSAADGGVFAFGQAPFLGSLGGAHLNRPIVGIAATAPGRTGGYRMVASDGGVFAFGDARNFGSTGGVTLNHPVVGLAATPSGNGYWTVASDGGVFAFGDAGFHGSTGGLALARPVVGITPTPSGRGYWLVASDGGLFAFGDAGFYGSTARLALNRPIIGMAATATGRGYWLVASDGGVFAFGDAAFLGSTGGLTLNRPIVAVDRTRSGRGYTMTASDGGVFSFGDARNFGSTAALPLRSPIVGLATLR